MSNRQISKVARQLIKAKVLITDPINWCKNRLRDGERMCAMGALWTVIGKKPSSQVVDEPTYKALQKAAYTLFGMHEPAHVNDKIGHTAVMQMYDLAIHESLINSERKP